MDTKKLRRVLAQEGLTLRTRATASTKTARSDLLRVHQQILRKLRDRVSRITLNDGSDAYNDLDNLMGDIRSQQHSVGTAMTEWDGTPLMESFQELYDALDELYDETEAAQREIEDEGLADMEDSSQFVQNRIEDKIYSLEQSLDRIQGMARDFSREMRRT